MLGFPIIIPCGNLHTTRERRIVGVKFGDLVARNSIVNLDRRRAAGAGRDENVRVLIARDIACRHRDATREVWAEW